MKKWIMLSVLFCFILVIAAGVFAYKTVQSPLYEQFDLAREYALNAEITEIADVDFYNGTETYYIVSGKDQQGEDVIMWIRDDFEFHHLEKTADGISEEQAAEAAIKNEEVTNIKTVRLGFEKKLPVYEIVYTGLENRQGYYYLTFSDGTFMKKYELRTN